MGEQWLKYFREELPTVAFKCSTQQQGDKLGRKKMPSTKGLDGGNNGGMQVRGCVHRMVAGAAEGAAKWVLMVLTRAAAAKWVLMVLTRAATAAACGCACGGGLPRHGAWQTRSRTQC